jgi:hypothetical protein
MPLLGQRQEKFKFIDQPLFPWDFAVRRQAITAGSIQHAKTGRRHHADRVFVLLDCVGLSIGIPDRSMRQLY